MARIAESGIEYSEETFRQLRLLETVIDSLSEGVAVGHREQGLILFNTSARKIMGQKLTNAPREDWSAYYGIFYQDGKRLVPTDQLPMIQALNGVTLHDFEMLIRSGSASEGRLISADAYPLGRDLAVVVFRDVTAERHREQMLKEAKEGAEAANRAKSEFLANVSHEIRSPIGAILGFSQLLEEGALLTSEHAAWLKTIRRNAVHLSSLVDGILDLSKIELGQLSVDLESFDPLAYLRQTIEPLADQARVKNLEFHFQASSSLPTRFVSDRVAIRRILINVVGNAIKFTDSGKIQVAVESYGQNQIQVSVRDTGIGISPDVVNRLFLPFSQGDSSLDRRFTGSGLGLLLSKRLAEVLGGTLTLMETQPGSGSCFVLRLVSQSLPKRSDRPDARRRAPDLKQLLDTKPLKGMRILVVEDSDDNRILLRHILSRAGAEVVTAIDGVEGLEVAEASECHLIVMDIQMPRLNGYQATHLLRARLFTKPIIALTAHALKEERENCLAAGCNDYLAKPIDAEVLVSTILRHQDRALDRQVIRS